MSDVLKGVVILAVAALVITVLAIGPEKVWCQVRGKQWVQSDEGFGLCIPGP